MKNCYYLALAPFLLVITPVAPTNKCIPKIEDQL